VLPRTSGNSEQRAGGIGALLDAPRWLSQWSIDDTNAEGERCAAGVTVPLLAIENTADDAVPQSHMGRLFKAAGSRDKTFLAIKGATHYYVGQPALLQEAVTASLNWLEERRLHF
jgi:alpha-beta hydrolase superfamily lysophospholipase